MSIYSGGMEAPCAPLSTVLHKSKPLPELGCKSKPNPKFELERERKFRVGPKAMSLSKLGSESEPEAKFKP